MIKNKIKTILFDNGIITSDKLLNELKSYIEEENTRSYDDGYADGESDGYDLGVEDATEDNE